MQWGIRCFAKSIISACEMGFIGGRKRLFCTMKEALSECEMGSFSTRVSEIRGAERME